MTRRQDVAKALAKYAARKAAKAAVKLGVKAVAAAVAAFGWPLALVLLVAVLIVTVFGGLYAAMPGSGLLTGATPSELDKEYRDYAAETVQRWNVEETWLVPGEGSYYPNTGGARLGRFVDRFGRDAALANTWADAYAPVLLKSSRDEQNDKMQDKDWVKDEIDDAAKKQRPWFYYKESKVIYSGPDGSDEETVYLLVEAYTLRGHRQYEYEWVTESSGNGSVTYEKLKRETILNDGTEYLRQFTAEFYRDMDNDSDIELAVSMTRQAQQAFNERKEWLDWLLAEGKTYYRSLSTAAIPPEYFGFLQEAEEKTGIPVWFLAGIITTESSWNPLAVNERTGCFGLTQLHPDYWPQWTQRYGFDPDKDMLNPRAQILVGAYVLRDYIGGSVDWENWKGDSRVKAGLARYGGYGEDVQAAEKYISRVVRAAAAFALRDVIWPVPRYTAITSRYGMRLHPVFGVWRIHTGIDIPAPEGTDVVSVSGGVVVQAGENGAWGNEVRVQDISHIYQYAHLSQIDVQVGQMVTPGQKIGEVGSTGASTGPHLHFGVKVIGSGEDVGWIDPELILRRW